jgi:hypothetical protein
MKATPSGDLVLRFLAQIMEPLKSNVLGKPAYSKNSLKQGLYHLTKRLMFDYVDFKLTPHHVIRINSPFDSLVKEKRLTVRKWRQLQWIGFLALRFIITSYISDAILNGVASWDIQVSKWLSIIVQSSADCRAGEVVRTLGYKGREFLAWSDIEIKLVEGDQFENLQARVTLLWEKESK